jgi:hypothetical protein
MSKSHRGFGIRDLIKNGRGTCPVCSRSGIKVLYDFEKDEKKYKICKQCKVSIAHGKRVDEVAAL